MNRSIKDMLNGENCSSAPQDVLEFLESQFDLENYEKTKTSYLSLMTVKNDKLLSHLKTSYHIAEFWKHMYLTEINLVDSKPVVKTEPLSSPGELENSEDSPMPPMWEQESSSIDIPSNGEFSIEAEDVEDDIDEAEGENHDSSAESPWMEESASTAKTGSDNVHSDTFCADSVQYKIEPVEERNVEKSKLSRPKGKKPSPGTDWRDLVMNPCIYNTETVEDFAAVKERWESVPVAKKSGMSNLNLQMRTELRNSLFRNGKLINHSTEALYFLHNDIKSKNKRLCFRKMQPLVKCRICGKKLTRKSYEHLFAHGPEYKYACPACDVSSFSHALELLGHYRVSHWDQVPLDCNQCSEVLYSPKELQHHILSHSSVSKKVSCRLCRFQFLNEDALKEHQGKEHVLAPETVPKKPQITWTCEICGKMFRCEKAVLKGSIEAHNDSVHRGKQYKCNECGKSFAQRGGLSTRIERCQVPTSVRRYKCVYTRMSFKTNGDLKSHWLYHKPPKCSCHKCSRSFYYANYLRVHKCPLENNRDVNVASRVLAWDLQALTTNGISD